MDSWEPDGGSSRDLQVVVDSRARVHRVLLPDDWQEWISAPELGDRIRHAANAAITARSHANPEHLTVADGGHHVTPDLDLFELWQRSDQEVAALQDSVQRSNPQGSAVGIGRQSRVRVTISRELVHLVELKQAWLADADARGIAHEVLSAFHDAYATVDAVTIPPPPCPAVEQLRAVVNDPTLLCWLARRAVERY